MYKQGDFMKLFLNNLVKGLITAFVVICLGGFISLNINISSSSAMILVSSSLINSINTKNIIKQDNQVEKEEVQDEVMKEEIKENQVENKEEITDKKENVNITDDNNQINKKEEKETTEDKKEEVKEEIKEEIKEEKIEISVKGNYSPNLEVLNTIEPIATYNGKITGYGPDCYGCSGITASGMNVLNGNIYYNDKTFGNIRIVAGDKSIPFGSIIKITGISISNDPILAIVLDRGGMIGFQEGKHSYFDLLYETEKAASSFGRQDATFELLRSGY